MKPFSWMDLPSSRGWERESFLYRVRSISDQTFQLRISARSAIDPPSNLERNSRSPVVRWTSSESPPFPIPCRAYDLDLVSLSRSSTDSIHAHRSNFGSSAEPRKKDESGRHRCHRVFVNGRPFFSARSRWSVVMKIHGAASCIVLVPVAFGSCRASTHDRKDMDASS